MILPKISKKWHEIEKILGRRSATVIGASKKQTNKQTNKKQKKTKNKSVKKTALLQETKRVGNSFCV